MIDETFEDLAQRELDGATTPEESARLHRWLESNDLARTRYAELQRVFDTLKLVCPIEPPADGITATLQAVRAAGPPPKPGRATVTNLSEFRMYMGLKSALLHRRDAMSKKVLMSVAAVAAAVIGYFAISGFPPTEKGADATIQGAKRHQVEQMKSEDVVLQDAETQAFLQTDFFNALITDKNFQRMAVDGALSRLMVSGGDRVALLSAALDRFEFREALSKKDLVAAMATLEKIQLSHSELSRADMRMTVSSALDRVDFSDALAKNDVDAAKATLEKLWLERSSVQRAELEKTVTAAFDRADFTDALSKKDVDAAMSVLDKLTVGKHDLQRASLQASVVNALDRTDFHPTIDKKEITADKAIFDRVTVGRYELQRLEMKATVSNALDRVNFREALAKKDVDAAMSAFDKIELARMDLDRVELKTALSSAELQKFFARNDVAALSTLARYEFRQSLGNAAFAKVVESPTFQRAMETGDSRFYVSEK